MHSMRSLFIGLTGALVAIASAQFDGPAPVAWRWLPPSGTTANGAQTTAVGAPLVHGDTIYVSRGGRIYAVDRSSGNKLWQFPAEDPIRGVFPTSPVLANGVMVAVGDNKIAYGVD